MAPFTYTHSPSLTPLTTHSPQSLSASSNPPIDYLMTSVLVLRQPQSQSPNKPQPQILLLRRHPADSYPLKWEPPGGSVDPSDPSVLSAAARELHEETHLSNPHFITWVSLAREFDPEEASRLKNWGVQPEEEQARDVEVRIGEEEGGIVVRVLMFFETKDVWGKMNFVATVDEGAEVEIDPEEHVDWGWFTEEEVRRGRAALPLENGNGNGEKKEEERVLEFTSQAVWGSVLEAFRVGRELGVIA